MKRIIVKSVAISSISVIFLIIYSKDIIKININSDKNNDLKQFDEKRIIPVISNSNNNNQNQNQNKQFKINETTLSTTTVASNKFDLLKKYPNFLNCRQNSNNNNNNKWTFEYLDKKSTENYNYSKSASNDTFNTRYIRGILIYFPIEKSDEFKHEFRWLYRSWIEMQKYEPAKWRTDLIAFIDNDSKIAEKMEFLKELNCTFSNRRKSELDNPMCTLVEYVPIQKRNLEIFDNPIFKNDYKNPKEKYHYLLSKVDMFDNTKSNLLPFYATIKEALVGYGYSDSILMAFDGYEYFKSAGYDYLIRSDMDVFLTPLFGSWLPRFCNDFYVGRGGYSETFNVNRLRRIANDLGIEFAGERNLGSTWYSTPDQFRIVSYLTLFGMAYLSREEFTQPEREGKVGVVLWPYWHYGVLLLYGQNLGLNHLIASKQINVVKLENILDFPSGNTESVFTKIHIHVFHGDDLFSKFVFKMGKYDNMTVQEDVSNQVKYYCLKMALEGKRLSSADLFTQLTNVTSKKT